MRTNLLHLLFFSSSIRLVFSFVLFFIFLFFSFSHFSSHSPSFSPRFLPIFSFLFDFLSSFLEHYTYGTKRRKFPPLLPQAKCVAIHFSFFFFYFLNPFYDIINHMAQCEPWDSFSHTWLIVSHSFKWTTWLCQVSLF